MSSVNENDENLGVHPAGSHSESEDTCDIFNLEQPTGRPSILRQSQFENLSNKSVPKGVKVCFQTPRRDPVTKRVLLSPAKNIKMDSLDACINTLASLRLTSSDEVLPQESIGDGLVLPSSDTECFPDDDMPIQSKGGYQLDFDDLDAMNPFSGSSKMTFSPAQPCLGATAVRSTSNSELEAVQITSISAPESEMVLEKPVETTSISAPESEIVLEKPIETISISVPESEIVLEEPVTADPTLDETLPFLDALENSVADTSTNMCSTDSPVTIDPKKLVTSLTDQSLDDTEELPKALCPVVPEPETNPDQLPATEPVAETLLAAKGTYSIDFDNLHSVDPFQTGGSKMCNSPAVDRKPEPMKSSPPKQDAPEQKSVESNPLIVESATEAPAPTEVKPAVVEEIKPQDGAPTEAPLPKGSYMLDFDKLDDPNFNPFGTKATMASSPAAGRPKPIPEAPEQKNVESNSLIVESATEAPAPAEVKPAVVEEISTSKATSEVQPTAAADDEPVKLLEFNFDDGAKVKSKPPFKKLGKKPPGSNASEKKTAPTEKKQASPQVVKPEPEKEPQDGAPIEAPLPKSSYVLDFDKLDDPNFNPFGTKANTVNSPAAGRPKPIPEAPEQKNVESNSVIVESATEAPAPTEVKPAIFEEISTSKETSEVQPTAAAADEPVKLLEFNFDDGAKVKSKPPFKKLGKKPPGSNASEKKTAPTEKKAAPRVVAPEPEKEPQAEAPLPKSSYVLDFDKLDDPNFNPFGTKANMASSPAAGRPNPIPEQKGTAEAVHRPSATPVAKIQPRQSGPQVQPSAKNAVSKMEDSNEAIAARQPEVIQPPTPVTCAPPSPPQHDQTTTVYPEPTELDQLQQNPDFHAIGQDWTGQEEVFVPGTTFMAGDFEGQMDYLEQFGSSTFQESALRKQSLYLKFDPLLRESPKKGAAANTGGFSLPRPSLAIRLDAQRRAEMTKPSQSGQADTMKFMDDFSAPAVCHMTQDPAVFDLLVPSSKQSLKNDGAIIDVLKYSQKDMDAALAQAQEEAEKKENEWKAKCDALVQEKQQLGAVLAEYDNTFAQINAEQNREKQAAMKELKKVFEEKEQVLSDLNSMERSFSDLFKRLEKHKEIIDGYKKNEESLRMCAQDYVARIKKEEQRYKSLKAHAEEKINLANAEIAEVRGKHRSEVSSLQIQQKRDQLKLQSLQKSLDQKVKETEELTKLCDELIVNVQKS